MSEIDQVQSYMRMAEQRIGQAFVNDGLPCHLCGGWQGPHTLSFAVRLYEPRQANLAKALKLAGVIEAAVGASPVRVYADAGVIFCEMPSPWPVIVAGPTLRGERLAVPIGLTPRKTIAGVDFDASPHLLCVGPTGRGKSVAMRGIAFHLARQNSPGRVALLALTFKPADWQAIGALSNAWAVITDPPEAARALAWLRDKMQERAKNGQSLPHVFALVDDLANLLGASPDCGQPLLEIASLGRAAGVHLVIGTQRLGQKGAGDALVASNIPDRLIFGTASAADAAFYAGRGQTGAEKLGAHPGDALLVSDGGAQRLAVGYVSDSDLGGLRQNTATVRPWASGTELVHPSPPAAQNDEKGGRCAGAPVHTGLLTRPPTADDVAALRTIFAHVGSKNKVFEMCGVAKNPLRAAWLTEALGGAT